VDADVCVVGGGPAGLVLALLLVRRGIRTVVLEKHADFLRDFRGDTVHPSTLTLLDELGLFERLERLPHRKVRTATFTFASGGRFRLADFSRLRVPHPYIALLPQWHFLDLLAEAAGESPGFTLLRSTEVVDVIREAGGAVTGVRANGPDGPVEVHARLTVAADGRHSTVRRCLGLRPKTFGAPMDVLWFRVPRVESDGEGLQARVGPGRLMIEIDRGDYWQCAWVIPKGQYDRVVAAGLERFRSGVAGLDPNLADRVGAIASWDDVKMLVVQIDRLTRWHAPGVLLIGDAAHAMSPVGGVGINLAVQDAVATARLLAGPLRGEGPLDLGKVRRRRRFPTAGTQLVQRLAQRGVLAPVLASAKAPRPPLAVRVVDRVPALQGMAARAVGLGLRPEHFVSSSREEVPGSPTRSPGSR
jgi:2-polyprenyl-6-methoxyphenol hydroxylase-like FAD-dependent oxidoreductase